MKPLCFENRVQERLQLNWYNSHGQSRNDGVAGTRNICHVLGLCRDMSDLSAPLEEGHSSFPEGQQDIVGLKPLHKVPSSLLNAFQVGKATAEGLFGFFSVWLEDGDILVFEEIIELGINSHSFSSFP